MIHLIRHRIQQSPVSANYFNKHKLRINLHQSYSTIYICNSILTTICCLVLFSLANSQKKGFVHTLTRCKVYSVIHNHFRRHFWKHFWKHLRLNFKYLATFVFFFLSWKLEREQNPLQQKSSKRLVKAISTSESKLSG